MLASRFSTAPAPVYSTRTLHWRQKSLPLTRLLQTSTKDGPTITGTNRAETSLKRFWKTVDVNKVDTGLAVTLDNRALKTPSGNKLRLPLNKRILAALVATEWENQDKILKTHVLPLTSLVSRAIDAMHDEPTRAQVREALLKYLDTDTIRFYQNYPDALVELQERHWDPILSWARDTFQVEINTFNSIFATPQPPDTLAKLDHVMSKLDPWQMAALERATYSSKSFLIGLALVLKRITPEEAALASTVEVSSQIQRWGEVEDSHDVDYQDVRRQLASAACLLEGSSLS